MLAHSPCGSVPCVSVLTIIVNGAMRLCGMFYLLPSFSKKKQNMFLSTGTRVKVFYFTVISIFGAKRFLLQCLCTALPRDYFSVDLCVTDIISCWFCFIFFKWQSFLCLFSHRYYHCSCCFFFYLSQTDPKHHFLYARGFFFFHPQERPTKLHFHETVAE